MYGLNDSISCDDRIVVSCRFLTTDPRASPKTASRKRMEDSMARIPLEEVGIVAPDSTNFQEQESQRI